MMVYTHLPTEIDMTRYLAAALLVTASLWVSGCQDNSGADGKIAALNNKVAQLEADLADQKGPVAKDDTKLASELSALRARLDALETEKSALEKKLTAQDGKLADVNKSISEVNKSIESLGGEVSATSAASDREARKQELKELNAEIRKEEREKQAADMKTRMADAERIAKENDIPFDANDPMGSMRKIMSDPALRQKAMEVMRNEGRKQRNTSLGLDERTSTELNRVEDETLKKMADIRQATKDGATTPEQAQKDVEQALADQDQQAKALLTEEQFKKYKESPVGMMPGMGGMIPGMGGMFPGMGGGR